MAVLATARTALTALLVAPCGALAADPLLYYVEDGQVVITNTPSRTDARAVPGLETRAAVPPGLPAGAGRLEALFIRVGSLSGVSPRLLAAMALVESNLDARAVSPKGALGLMQLMPATARRYGVDDPFDPAQNLLGGARHMRDLLDEFGDVRLALAAYNAGSGAVRRNGGIPPYPETREYVRRIEQKLGRRDRSEARPRQAPPPAEPVRLVRRSDGTIVLEN